MPGRPTLLLPRWPSYIRRRMPSTMGVELFVPEMLRHYCGKARTLDVPGPTVRAVLARIERDYPALYVNVCDETGAVRRHINIFVNDDHVRDLDGLDSALAPGDAVTILPAVSVG
jgi:molybdopterin synthase sulfur carrier subunit